MEALLQKSYAVINHHPNLNLISLHLVREVNFNDYKSVMNIVLEKLVEKNCLSLIMDQRYVEDLGMEETAWFISNWFPRISKIVKDQFKLSLISSKSLYARMGSEYIINTLASKSKFVLQSHRTMDEALKWISE